MAEAEKLDLGNGDWAEVNTDLGYQDRRWWRIRVAEVRKAEAAARPPAADGQESAPDLSMAGNISLIEELTARLVVASSVPGLVPWTPEAAEALSHSHGLEACDAIEDAVIGQMNRLNGVAAPKPPTSGGGSVSGSSDGQPSPLPDATPEPSSTQPG